MHRSLALASACAVFSLHGFASIACAQEPLTSGGRAVAVKICADCHAIDPGKPAIGKEGAPSFTSVANMPSTTALSLKVFLRSPHANMPSIQLSDSDLDALVDYILEMKTK